MPLGFLLVGFAAIARLIRVAGEIGRLPAVAAPASPGRRQRAVVACSVLLIGVAAVAWQAGRVSPSFSLVVAMFATFLALIFTGFPIAFVLGGVAVWFIAVGYGTDFVGYTLSADHPGTKFYLGTAAAFVNRIYGGLLNKPELVALPMFIFMGLLLDRSGLAAGCSRRCSGSLAGSAAGWR